MELTEEDIKNMSPEEIAELQKQQCIFCKIVSGEVSSRKLYEDEHCIAVLDINPANPGHVLVISKKHYQVMPQIPEPVISHIFTVVKKVSRSVLKSLKAGGTNIFVASGNAAGQRAPHFMVHVIPRKKGDGLKIHLQPKDISESDIEQVRVRLKKGKVAKKQPVQSQPKTNQQVVDAEDKPDLDRISKLF